MSFDPVFLSNYSLVIVGFGAAFLVALWVSLLIWTYRDMRSRGRDNLALILALLLVAILTFPGIIIYLVLRPKQTLEEEYQKTLEEEALLQAIEDQILCPGCERKVNEEWVICPSCHTRLNKTCVQCGKPLELSWNICPFCETPIIGFRKDIDTFSNNIIPDMPAVEETISQMEIIEKENKEESEFK